MAFRLARRPLLAIVFLLLLIGLLLGGGAVLFDWLGIIRLKEVLAPVTRLVGIRPRTKITGETYHGVALDEARYDKQRQALLLQEEDLEKQKKEMELKLLEIEQRAKELAEKEKALEEKEKTLNAVEKMYENKVARLEQSAVYLAEMPPEQAKEVLLNMDDWDVVDLLRTSERLSREAGSPSLVAYWLSLMPAERAGEIQRKMLLAPGDHER